LHIKPEAGGSGRVALTLDACGGKTDTRILSALVENRIPATIFVTGIWLKRNAAAVEVMRAHPDLFEDGARTPTGGCRSGAIEVPLLVVQGNRDSHVTMEEAREIASLAPAASTELRVVEGGSHGFLAGDTIRRTPPQLLDMVEAVTAWMRRWLLSRGG
jgi:peptidoglycan/xylan/chitin deacetylase (PgdA/CDA1 family)